MTNVYVKNRKSVLTPQNQPIPGREAEMVPNNAGGYSFELDDWERLNRFLILGSEKGTYYVGQEKLKEQNATCVIRCIKADGVRVADAAAMINISNRTPKVDQQLFVLALCLKHGDIATRRRVAELVPSVVRIGMHLLHFAAMVDSLGGWGNLKKRIFADWFLNKSPDDVAFQILKYRNRDGWTMRDILRLAHPKPEFSGHMALFAWVTGKLTNLDHLPRIIADYLDVTTGTFETPVQQALAGIARGLPRECLPTEALADKAVWSRLLRLTPPHALIRNLATITANGTIVAGNADACYVVERLEDAGSLARARVHPFALLLAALIYRQGHGFKGTLSWLPLPSVVGALDNAYDAAFATILPTNKRILIGVDTSRSMSGSCTGTPIDCATAAAAMAITLARNEPAATVVRFDTCVRSILPVTLRTGISDLRSTSGGGTDISAPIRWASGDKSVSTSRWGQRDEGLMSEVRIFDAFIILTDNETWAGSGHPSQALVEYRKKVNPQAKLICCSMAANHANIVDPEDGGSFGTAGLDAHLPNLVRDFLSS
jgi:60 kDa SS-A/Ro ribonucleoprotein